MMRNLWFIIFVILTLTVLTACSEDDWTEEEILDKTIDNTEALENYAFALNSEQIDGMENKVVLELEGKAHTQPFQAKVDKKQNVFKPEESTSYYKDDIIYYDFGADHFIKAEPDEQPDHLLNGLKELSLRQTQLEFQEEEEVYTYKYIMESEEEDSALLQALYPFYISPELMTPSHIEFNLKHSDITEFQVEIKIDKHDFFVKEMTMNFRLDYDLLDSGEPVPLSETVEVTLFDHNEAEEISMPNEQIQEAQTFVEFWGFGNEDEEENEERDATTLVEEELGNTGANLMTGNGGAYATDGEWIYYSYVNEGFYRVKEDGTGKQMLSENQVSSINVIDNWLFFIDHSEESRVYRMQKDGTERRQVTEEMVDYVIVADDWVYYSPIINTPSGDLPVRRITIDLKNEETILDKVNNFTVGQEHIIYREDFDEMLSAKHIKNGEDNELNVLLHGIHALHFSIADGWLYFVDREDNNHIYRKNLHGWELEQLTESSSAGFNISGNYLFFTNNDDNGSLYRYNIATETMEKIEEGEVHQLQIINDDLYFAKARNLETIEWYRMEVSGSVIEKVNF